MRFELVQDPKNIQDLINLTSWESVHIRFIQFNWQPLIFLD